MKYPLASAKLPSANAIRTKTGGVINRIKEVEEKDTNGITYFEITHTVSAGIGGTAQRTTTIEPSSIESVIS